MSINYQVLEGTAAAIDAVKIDRLLGFDTTEQAVIYYDQSIVKRLIMSMDSTGAVTNTGKVKSIPFQDDGWLGLGSTKGRISFEDDAVATATLRNAELVLADATGIWWTNYGTGGSYFLENNVTNGFRMVNGAGKWIYKNSDFKLYDFIQVTGGVTETIYSDPTGAGALITSYDSLCTEVAYFSATNEYAENRYRFNWYNGEGGYTAYTAGYMKAGKETTWANPAAINGYLSWGTILNGTLTERMRLASSGQLSVYGDTLVQGPSGYNASAEAAVIYLGSTENYLKAVLNPDLSSVVELVANYSSPGSLVKSSLQFNSNGHLKYSVDNGVVMSVTAIGELGIKTYSQTSAPSVEEGMLALWKDTDGGPSYWLVWTKDSVSRTIQFTAP